MRAIRLLNLRPLLRQRLRSALALVAIAAGTALATAVVIEQQSFAASIAAFAHHVGGPTPLRVVGADTHGGLDETILARVAAVPGVATAIPVVQTVTYAERANGPRVAVVALGFDCSVESVVGPVGCQPAALAAAPDSAPPLISPTLARALGAGAYLRHDLGRLSLDGAVTVAALDRLNGGRVAVFPLPEAQRLFVRPGRLDAIYVRPAPGVGVEQLRHQLATVVGPANAVLRASDPAPGSGEALFLIPELAFVSLVALGVGGLLVFNLVSLALVERRRDLAIAGALGATDRLVIGGAVAEATVLGLTGGLLGIAGAIGLAHPLVATLSKQVGLLGGIHVTVHVSPVVAVVSAVLGAGVGALAAIVPARRASRWELAGELQQRGSVTSSAPPSVRRAGLCLLAEIVAVAGARVAHAHGATSRWQPLLGAACLALATIGAFVAVGAITPLVIQLAHRRAWRHGGAIPLALANLSRESSRTGIMALAVGAAVGMSTMLASSVPAIHDVTLRFGAEAVAGKVSLSTLDLNNTGPIDAKVSPAVQAALLRVPGVAGLDRLVFVQVGHSASRLIGVFANDRTNFVYHVYEGRADDAALRRGEVFIGPGLARDRGLHPGSTLQLETPTGMATVRVGAVWEDPDNIGHGVTMSYAKAQQLFGAQPPFGLFARPVPGVTPEQLAARIKAARLDPDLQVLAPADYIATFARTITAFLAPFWAMQRGLLLVAFIATLSILLLVGLQRRRELGTLAAVGMGPRDLARMTLVEAGTVGLVASVISAITLIGPTLAFTSAALFFAGSDAPFHYSVGPAIVYAAIAVAVVLAGAALPAWRTSRLEVIEALRWE